MLKTEKARGRFVTAILISIVEIVWFIGEDFKHFLLLNGFALLLVSFFWCTFQIGRWIGKGE